MISDLIPAYLGEKRKLSPKSHKTYSFILNLFAAQVQGKQIQDLTHNDFSDFLTYLDKSKFAPATISLAVSAVKGFFEWAAFKRYWPGSVGDIQYISKQSKPTLISAAPVYDRDILIQFIEWARDYKKRRGLIEKRDAFMILTAASTGGRIGKELCQLKRGQINWETGRAIVIGKGNREGVLRLSVIALQAGQVYMKARAEIDGRSGHALASLPLFSHHNNDKTTRPLGYAGAYKSLKLRFALLFGEENKHLFHPHLLRHEFVTSILIESGNLKLAKELARHQNIETTNRYAHLSESDLDEAHSRIFNVG